MKYLFILFLLFFSNSFIHSSDVMEELFLHPPQAAKPKIWMFAMDGNLSKEGMLKDLESIEKVGIGGVMLFNVSQNTPLGTIKFNSTEHLNIIKYASHEAKHLGLTFGVNNCDGISLSGGAWILPEESMKMVVWKKTFVNASNKQNISLQKPAYREGFYKDIAILAYPSLKSEIVDQNLNPIIKTSDSAVNVSILHDTKMDKSIVLKQQNKVKPWILFDYKNQVTIRSVLLYMANRQVNAKIYKSNDSVKFEFVQSIVCGRITYNDWALIDNIIESKARYFRIVFDNTVYLKKVNLFSTKFIDNTLGRTSMTRIADVKMKPITHCDKSMLIKKQSIIDVTPMLDSDGVLNYNLPEGDWTILRIGYTSNGAKNYLSTMEGAGLECDKMSKTALKKYYNGFVGKLAMQKNDSSALRYVQLNAFEQGGQNWTDNFSTFFKEENGYDFIFTSCNRNVCRKRRNIGTRIVGFSKYRK